MRYFPERVQINWLFGKVFSFDEIVVDTAVLLNSKLKKKRKQIDLADLFIAATAVAHNLRLSTLNKKHFDRIDTLRIIE